MKIKYIRLLFLGILSSLIFSCNPTNCTNGVQDGNETGIDCGGNCPPCATFPNGNSSQNNDNWKFKITIDGITHEAEGYGIFNSSSQINNAAYVSSVSVIWTIYCQITDPSSSSFISGNNGSASIQINNPSIGTTMCCFSGTWFADAAELSGASPAFFGYSLTQGGVMEPGSDGCLGVNLPITITDLGTAGNSVWVGGTSLKGSYSGTIYLNALGTMNDYSIPMDIDIEFEALRQ